MAERKVVKTILVMSDTHRQYYGVNLLAEKLPKPDYIIHLGDVEADQVYIQAVFGCPVEMVAGNNDYFSTLPYEFMIHEGNHQILLTHGHTHHVHSGTAGLVNVARSKKADTVIYGHTHVPKVDFVDGITIINPGSLSLPRQERRLPTYIIMRVFDDGEIDYHVEELDI